MIQYIEMDLRNKTTSEVRTVFHSPLGVPNSPGSTVFDYLFTNTHIGYTMRVAINYIYMV